MSRGINIGGSVQGSTVLTGDNNKVGDSVFGGEGKNTTQESTEEMKRRKSEKFGILDSPALLAQDLDALAKKDPRWGASVFYLDIDDFKEFNTKYKERVVDTELLPYFQELIASTVEDIGHAYAEGGDEIIILLPNHSQKRAELFAQELLALVRNTQFYVMGDACSLTVSMGIASSSRTKEFKQLPAKANQGKAMAKKQGKNQFVIIK